MRRLCLFLACLVVIGPILSSVAHVIAAKGPIWLHATYKGGFAPQKVMVDIHIDPTDEDRLVWLGAFEGDFLATSSEIPLSFGSQSQRTHHWTWVAGWPGEYTILARIGHGSTIRASATERVTIP